MSRTSAIIVLGILGMLTPFSGLPSSFRSLLTIAVGLATFMVGVSLRKRETRVQLTGVG